MKNKKRVTYKRHIDFPKGKSCQLCDTQIVDVDNLGEIYQTSDVIVHYFCLLSASQVLQNGKDTEGILGFFAKDIKSEVKRGSTIVCCYCKKNGATVSCSGHNCIAVFHLPCGIKNGSLHHYYDQFRSFCKKHKPKQKLPRNFKKKSLDCAICFTPVKVQKDPYIWPPCCKPEALIHKHCCQRYAANSGYAMKCPLCNDRDYFGEQLRYFGIFVPDQEAIWEVEALGQREETVECVAVKNNQCICPKGSRFSIKSSPKWFIELCKFCGSGMHLGCMETPLPRGAEFECPDCLPVFNRDEGERNLPKNTIEDSDSDDERSVSGTDSEVDADDEGGDENYSVQPALTLLQHRHPSTVPSQQPNPSSATHRLSLPSTVPPHHPNPSSVMPHLSHPSTVPPQHPNPSSVIPHMSHPSNVPTQHPNPSSVTPHSSHPSTVPFQHLHLSTVPIQHQNPSSVSPRRRHPSSTPRRLPHTTSVPNQYPLPSSALPQCQHPSTVPPHHQHPSTVPHQHPSTVPPQHPSTVPPQHHHPSTVPPHHQHPSTVTSQPPQIQTYIYISDSDSDISIDTNGLPVPSPIKQTPIQANVQTRTQESEIDSHVYSTPVITLSDSEIPEVLVEADYGGSSGPSVKISHIISLVDFEQIHEGIGFESRKEALPENSRTTGLAVSDEVINLETTDTSSLLDSDEEANGFSDNFLSGFNFPTFNKECVLSSTRSISKVKVKRKKRKSTFSRKKTYKKLCTLDEKKKNRDLILSDNDDKSENDCVDKEAKITVNEGWSGDNQGNLSESSFCNNNPHLNNVQHENNSLLHNTVENKNLNPMPKKKVRRPSRNNKRDVDSECSDKGVKIPSRSPLKSPYSSSSYPIHDSSHSPTIQHSLQSDSVQPSTFPKENLHTTKEKLSTDSESLQTCLNSSFHSKTIHRLFTETTSCQTSPLHSSSQKLNEKTESSSLTDSSMSIGDVSNNLSSNLNLISNDADNNLLDVDNKERGTGGDGTGVQQELIEPSLQPPTHSQLG